MSEESGFWAEETTGGYDFDGDGVPDEYETYQDSSGFEAIGVDLDHDGVIDEAAYVYEPQPEGYGDGGSEAGYGAAF